MERKRGVIFFLCIGIIFLIAITNGVLATTESLGTFKQNNTIRISQVCSDSTWINLSSITYPNSSIAYSNIEMSSSGSGEYYFDFNLSDQTGRYDVRGISDGCTNTFATYFLVTLNGNDNPEGITVVVYTVIFIVIFGFGIVYFILSLGHIVQLDMDLMDMTVMVSTYLALWIYYYLCFEYLGNPIIIDILELALDIGAITHVFLPIVGFIVSFIMTNLKFKQKARITY